MIFIVTRMKSNMWISIQGFSDLVSAPNWTKSSRSFAVNFLVDHEIFEAITHILTLATTAVLYTTHIIGEKIYLTVLRKSELNFV